MRAPYFYKLVLCIMIAIAAPEAELSADEGRKSCESTKEFVTMLQYLRDNKKYAVKDDKAQEIAHEVSKGCSGAAERFVRVSELLVRSHLATPEAITLGKLAAQSNKEATQSFVSVFKESFLSKYLDMNVRESTDLARALSFDFKGDSIIARADFRRTVEYCLDDDEGLGLPKRECANLAGRIAGFGEGYTDSVSGPFIQLIDYIRSKDGPARSTGEAIVVATEVMKHGPFSARNYIQAYKYASSKDGLGMDVTGAMGFAKELAARSSQEKTKVSKKEE